ncbi:MAG: hypothetical protein K2W82_06900 [Candidatus Obscuribacterales bacterium]|nr:hypothetical protein [Candidatus Obscuribacterales bacterium]
MIQCPICQILNEDQSRFCKECGARMTGGQTVPEVAGNNPAPGPAKTAPKKLRSPLLAAEEFDEEPYEEVPPPNRAGSKPQHLHSPLLGSGDEAPLPRPLRSPLLSNVDKPKFDIYYDADDYDPYADEDNPNILRSPLLSAKVPLEEGRKAQPKPVPQQEPQIAAQVASPVIPPVVQPPVAQPPQAPVLPPPTAPMDNSPPLPSFAQPPISKPQVLPAQQQEQFPDMTQFRRPADVPPVVPPELAPAPQSFTAPAPVYTPPAPSVQPIAPSPPVVNKPEPPVASPPPRRMASKMLGNAESLEEDDEPSFRQPTGFAPKQFAGGSDQQQSSPLVKILGGVVILMAIIKTLAVMQYMPTQMGQYPPFLMDEFSTLVAMFAIGLGFLVSRK